MNWLDLCGAKIVRKETERIQGIQKFKAFKDVPLVARNETTLLYKYLEKLAGKFPLRTQGTGDCVSMGAALAVDILKGVQAFLKNTHGSWIAETATEVLYALSRVEIGGGAFRGEAGSTGAWAAEAVKKYGTLARGVYGSIDLSIYSSRRADDWGDRGCPDELESLTREHQVLTVTRVYTTEDVKAAITNGYPVTIASNAGFQNRRDKNGFSWPEGIWPHQMCIIAYRTDIEGFLIQNSWGIWNSGPKAWDQPEGSFWVTPEVLQERILNDGDCWSFSNFEDYPPQKLTLFLT